MITRWKVNIYKYNINDENPVWEIVGLPAITNGTSHKMDLQYKNNILYETGGTNQNGWYASGQAYYSSTDKAAVYLFDIATGDQLSGVFDITPTSDPIWFVTSADKRMTNTDATWGVCAISF